MKKKEFLRSLRSQNIGQVYVHAVGASERLFRARFSKAAGQLASSADVKNLRKEVARSLTILSEVGSERSIGSIRATVSSSAQD